MADKSFGVKELNLLNASGTPTITSPNNLNLNANNVAISTNVTIGGNLTVSANAGIASLNVTGVATFVGVTTFKDDIYIVGNQLLSINDALTFRGSNGGNSFISNYIDTSGGAPGDLYISNISGKVEIDTSEHFSVKTNTNEQAILATQNGSVALYHDGGNKKLETSNTGVTVTGTLAATAVTGDGSGLTGISAGISTSPSNVQATWKLGGGSGSGFTFTGPGQDGSEGNPDIYLVRGQRYLFDNTTLAGNHPFEFRNAANNADYTDGVSGAQNGLQYINVQHDAPAQLKYRCTQHPNSMLGNIYIVGQHLANGADNRVLTATSAYGMNAESGLTYNGQKIQVDTVTSETNAFRLYNTTTSATTYQINGEGDSFTGNVYPRSDGNLDLGFHSGYKWRDLVLSGGVRFGSANAQDYLDDYEEGSWTPEIKGTTGAGTASYNNQVGRYLKIGNFVYFTWVLGWSSGSAGGEMRTTGFPFTPATDCTGMGSVMFNNVSIHSNVSNIATYIGPGNDYCYFYTSRSSSGWITVNYSSSGNLIANVAFRTT